LFSFWLRPIGYELVMLLSDRDIKKAREAGEISLEPFELSLLQPCSVDLRLGDRFLLFRRNSRDAIDVKEPIDDLMDEIIIGKEDSFVLHPGEFVLASTIEKVGLSPSIAAQINGKSSLGRIGIIVHATAGFIDPGNTLCPTLELNNIGKLPVRLYWKMPIAQVTFMRLSSPAERPYGSKGLNSKYYGDEGPHASKMYLNFKSTEPGANSQ